MFLCLGSFKVSNEWTYICFCFFFSSALCDGKRNKNVWPRGEGRVWTCMLSDPLFPSSSARAVFLFDSECFYSGQLCVFVCVCEREREREWERDKWCFLMFKPLLHKSECGQYIMKCILPPVSSFLRRPRCWCWLESLLCTSPPSSCCWWPPSIMWVDISFVLQHKTKRKEFPSNTDFMYAISLSIIH